MTPLTILCVALGLVLVAYGVWVLVRPYQAFRVGIWGRAPALPRRPGPTRGLGRLRVTAAIWILLGLGWIVFGLVAIPIVSRSGAGT